MGKQILGFVNYKGEGGDNSSLTNYRLTIKIKSFIKGELN